MKYNIIGLICVSLLTLVGCSSNEPSKSDMADAIGKYYSQKWINHELSDIKISKMECLPTKEEGIYDCQAKYSYRCQNAKDVHERQQEIRLKKANNEWHAGYMTGSCPNSMLKSGRLGSLLK